MLNYTVQLAVQGQPSAFDLSPNRDNLVVASPGCLTFFRLNGLGTPRHVIHYEQPQQVRQIKYQRQGGHMLSALRAGVVSLWEPARALRPLVGHIKSQGGGWISDMAWSPNNGNLLATSCDGGRVSVWDVRAPLWPTQQVIAGGVCNCVDWCPTNANLLSVVAASGQRLIVFDSRMVGGTINVNMGDVDEALDSEGGGVTVNSGSCDYISAIEVDGGGITHASWCGSNSSSLPPFSSTPFSSSIILGTASGRLEYWDLQTGMVDGVTSGPLQSTQFANLGSQTGALLDSESLLLATPLGRGAVLCRRQDLVLTENGVREAKSKPTAVAAATARTSPAVVIKLQGCPRDSLLNVFSPPDQRTNKGLEYGPSIELAHVSSSPILGVLWGAPGRLIPPVHGGLELLFLTESASLTAIRVPQDVIRKYCYSGGGASKSDLASIALEKARSRDNVALLENSSSRPVALFSSNSAALIAPRYPLSGLKSAKDLEFGDELAAGKKKKSSKAVAGAGMGVGVGGSADRGGDRFWAGIRGEVLVLEDAVQRGLLLGLIIGRIDQYARQVTLEMEIPRLWGLTPQETRKGRRGSQQAAADEDNERVLALILRFPSRGIPSFTLRGLEGAEESAFGTALSAELDSIARAFNSDAPAGFDSRSEFAEDGFLLAVANCFRNRCTKPQAYHSPRHDDDEEPADATGKSSGNVLVSDIIDPIAYRVPSPACSGGRWSPKGVLLCFGGATLVDIHTAATSRHEFDEANDGVPPSYPKSLGDMLIMERAREEAYAQHMQHLKLLQPKHAEVQDGSEDGDESENGSSVSDSDSDLAPGTLGDEGIGNSRERKAISPSAASTGAGTARTGTGGTAARYLGLDEHLLPLAHQGQTLESLGEDLDLIAKAEARTAGFRRTLTSGTNNERALWLAAAAAASSSGIVSSLPSQLEFHDALSAVPRTLAEHYSLGPLPLSHAGFYDIKARADACRRNAELVMSVRVGRERGPCPYSALQIWSLLAVSLDLYAAAQEDPDGLASEGAMLGWTENVLGSSLVRRIMLMLAEYHEVQMLATCVCVLGGSAQTIAMLAGQHGGEDLVDSQALKRLLDRALACYSDILCRWGALTRATEVRKHRAAAKEDERGANLCAGVNCLNCGTVGEILDCTRCAACTDYSLYCALCQCPVRGSVIYCASCGHGGCPSHIKTWFETSVECATGCGCRCAENGGHACHPQLT